MDNPIFASLAEAIVETEATIDALEGQVKNKKEELATQKKQLCELMMQAGLDSIRLANGLSPQPKVQVDYFKGAGVTDDQLFEWLTTNGLEGVIRPTVPFQTLQATMREFVDAGGQLPEILTRRDTPTVIMRGKSKYLESKMLAKAG